MSTFDVVVAGGGVNGLACAATLAREGAVGLRRRAQPVGWWRRRDAGSHAAGLQARPLRFLARLDPVQRRFQGDPARARALRPEVPLARGSHYRPSGPARRPGNRHLPLDREDLRQHRTVLQGRCRLLSPRPRRFRVDEGRIPEGVLLASLAALDDGASTRGQPRGLAATAGVLVCRRAPGSR